MEMEPLISPNSPVPIIFFVNQGTVNTYVRMGRQEKYRIYYGAGSGIYLGEKYRIMCHQSIPIIFVVSWSFDNLICLKIGNLFGII